jgi:hypothetical protein
MLPPFDRGVYDTLMEIDAWAETRPDEQKEPEVIVRWLGKTI